MPCASPRLDRNKGNGYNCPCICARRCILLYSSWLEHGNVVVALIDFRFHWSTVRGIGGHVSRVCYQSFTGVICDIGREYDISIHKHQTFGVPIVTKSKPLSAELGDYLNFFLGSGYSYCWHTNPNGKIEPPIRNELRVTNGCLPTTAILHKQVTCCTWKWNPNKMMSYFSVFLRIAVPPLLFWFYVSISKHHLTINSMVIPVS